MRSEMIDRVAKAIYAASRGENAFVDGLDEARVFAEAAVQAMREPFAGLDAIYTMSISYGPEEIWRMMIDAALEKEATSK